MRSTWYHSAQTLTADLQRVFGDRLQAVVAYGPRLEGADHEPLTCLALVNSLDVADLEACAQSAGRWERDRLATPLLLTRDEFVRSLDAFPLEYGEILRVHERVFGDDPFNGVAVAREDTRRMCEQQVKSHLLHLREGYIESGGRPLDVARLVAASAPAFGALLRTVARLAGHATSDRTTLTFEGARAAGLPDGLVRDLVELEHPTGITRGDAARLFPDYLTSVERLARTVDGWRT